MITRKKRHRLSEPDHLWHNFSCDLRPHFHRKERMTLNMRSCKCVQNTPCVESFTLPMPKLPSDMQATLAVLSTVSRLKWCLCTRLCRSSSPRRVPMCIVYTPCTASQPRCISNLITRAITRLETSVSSVKQPCWAEHATKSDKKAFISNDKRRKPGTTQVMSSLAERS